MSIEKITSSILAEAEAARDAALQEARAKCERILGEAAQKAKDQKEAMVQRGREEKEKIILRRRSVAAIDSKKVILEKKQQVIAECFRQAEAGIAALPREKYLDFLVRTGLASAMPGGAVSFNEGERQGIGPEVVRRLNAAVPPQKSGDAGGEPFILSEDSEDVSGGFWIRQGQTYADITVSSQVAAKKKELAAQVSRMLFEE